LPIAHLKPRSRPSD